MFRRLAAIVALVVLPLWVSACDGTHAPSAPTPPSVPSSQRWAAFGDSVTEGYTLTDFSQSFVGRLTPTLGPIAKCWIGASRMEQQVTAMASCSTDATSVLWLAGYNDMRAGTDLEQLRMTLARGLDILTAEHRTVYLGACLRMSPTGYALGPPMWNHGSDAAVAVLNAMMRAEAARRQNVYFVEFPTYNPETMVVPDFVHPTPAGHAVLADAFLAVILARAHRLS